MFSSSRRLFARQSLEQTLLIATMRPYPVCLRVHAQIGTRPFLDVCDAAGPERRAFRRESSARRRKEYQSRIFVSATTGGIDACRFRLFFLQRHSEFPANSSNPVFSFARIPIRLNLARREALPCFNVIDSGLLKRCRTFAILNASVSQACRQNHTSSFGVV